MSDRMRSFLIGWFLVTILNVGLFLPLGILITHRVLFSVKLIIMLELLFLIITGVCLAFASATIKFADFLDNRFSSRF